ncbi:MAG: ABC transporter substrate-binding protein [Clostridiales bacterium]|nr:ABC transporter substrate-binding protein [Clostridiales bacterium]
MKFKRLAALMLAGLMAFSAAGCGGSGASNGSSDAADGTNSATESGAQSSASTAQASEGMVDKVVFALTASDFDMSPFATGSTPRNWMVQNVYAALYCMPYYGASLEEMEPWLAKSCEKVDDLTYKVTLYDYIHDSKGNAITSEDIVFSYDMCYEKGGDVRIGSYLDNIEIVDDYTMLFHLKKSGPGVMEYLMGNYTLSVCDKEWYESATDEEKNNDPAATGAYKIVDYAQGASITLEAVEGYWQTDDSLRCSADTQNVKTIEYKVITEASMRSIALENGEIDATVIDASELKRYYSDGQPLDGYTVNIADGTFCYTAFVNMEPGQGSLAEDENLRKAALYALDSESILYGGNFDEDTGEVCYSLGTPVMAGYNDSWSEDYFNYDPDKAKEFYEASGHKEGEVTIRLLSRTSIPDGIHSVMVANLEAAGFKVELLTYDQALFSTYNLDPSQWDIMLDNKGATGNIVTCWDNNFNPENRKGNTVCFTQDDTLIDDLNAATATGSEEDIEAFHQHLKDLACCKGLFTSKTIIVGQDGIIDLALTGNMEPRVNAFTFASDYQSVAQ